jgi:hypothetical protein
MMTIKMRIQNIEEIYNNKKIIIIDEVAKSISTKIH